MPPFFFGTGRRLNQQPSSRLARPSPLALVALTLIALGTFLPLLSTFAQEDAGEVYVVSITGTIDLGLAPYLDRVLEEAAEAGAQAVLLEIDTPGGRLDAVLQMRDSLLASQVPTIAFVNRTAFSAGALVAIASEQIYMAPGGVMGAATPIDGVTGETASEKTISAVRTTFETTAEARGRDPIVAEAMVDDRIEIPDLIAEGQLLTLTSTEAITWGYAEDILETREEVLAAAGFPGVTLVETNLDWAERLVRFITDPIVASLLMLGGLFLIVGDFFVEGLGLPALAGAGLLALFFWGHQLAGLAGWEDLGLIVLGVTLIAVELLIIPGFGIPGILGLVSLLAGFYLALVGREIQTPEATERAITMVGVVFAGLVIGVLAVLLFLPKMRGRNRLVLADRLGMEPALAGPAPPRGWLNWFGGGSSLVLRSDEQPVSPSLPEVPQGTPGRSWVGAVGVALSDLRPAGIATIEGQRVDVVTDGDWIAAGQQIEVIRDESYRRVVRRLGE
jgi:membrane-bound serine protease (ClpP class)